MGVYDKVFDCGIRLRKAILDSPVAEVTDRIFPVSTQVSTQLPFVTFFRSGMDETSVKDTRAPRTAYFTIQVYSDDWQQAAEIASLIDDRLEDFRDEGIRSCQLMDTSENFDYTVPAYIQILTYKVKTY